MTQAISPGAESIFRVKAAATDHWVVFRNADAEPIAAFGDKASALAYALHLARHRPGSEEATAHPHPRTQLRPGLRTTSDARYGERF